MRFALGFIRKTEYKNLDTFYLVRDPWDMASASQQYRFKETNRLIVSRFGRVGSLLEIGCGEGHQSAYLQDICDRLTGLDISRRAVRRARMRCPGGNFMVGGVFSEEIERLATFDLVVACEVLYYLSNVHEALQWMRRLGINGLVSYYAGARESLDPVVQSLPGIGSEVIHIQQSSWRFVWW